MNNKELINAGHALAKAISNDTPLIEIAKMVSNLATQLDVQLARSNALAAENAGLKQFPDQIVGFIGKLGSSEIGSETKEKIEAAAKKIKTPATDAFLAEVQASAIEHAASERWGSGYVFDELNEFAAQLRQEAAQ
ncbi:TPA: hypothetical protein QCI56_001134 [Enterobacter asburiae]|uniref:Uncharacterized protein n=1 Tax=Enterobacter asburiae TaxID=61645 RepID=A0A455VRQ7_ENTAS|nr:hypothetical protein MRY18106EAS_26690 [Enterobacter asburiae]HDR2660250.1 hypothetical protein [Enterobacter asburiae]